MITGKLGHQLIIATARELLQVPFQHQGRTTRGLDCVGVLIYVAHKLDLSKFDTTAYGRSPRPDRMREILRREMVEIPIAEASISDVFHMAWKRVPQHVAMITDVGILHCWEGAGQVVEHPLDAEWRGRVRAAFRFPGV